MGTHLTILGVLYALTSVGELVAALVLLGVAGAGALVPEPLTAVLLATLGTVLGGFFLILAVPGLLLAWALIARKSWAVPLGWILAILNLFNVPVGTALGIYTIWALSRDETRLLLRSGPATRSAARREY